MPREFDTIVPEYNEFSKNPQSFHSQLEYFSSLPGTILVDDGSTDGSWGRIEEFAAKHQSEMRTLKLPQNERKVGAIKRGVGESDKDYVFLTDFDSRVVNSEKMEGLVEKFEKNPKLSTIVLKITPNGGSLYSKFQGLEYALSSVTSLKYPSSQGMVMCASGPGSFWRKDALQKVLSKHSGQFLGDDMEMAAIAMSNGYELKYDPSIVVETEAPQTFRGLHKQRKRWERGMLETFGRESGFYLGQVKDYRSRLGHVTASLLYNFGTLPLFLAFAVQGIQNPQVLANYYLSDLAVSLGLSYFARKEMPDKKTLALLPLIPIYRLAANLPAKIAASTEFLASKLPHINLSGKIPINQLAYKSWKEIRVG